MSYLFLKKENGKITEKEMISALSSETVKDFKAPYFTDEENCFVKQLHVNPSALNTIFQDFYRGEYSINKDIPGNREKEDLAFSFLEIQRDVSEMVDKILSSSNALTSLQELFGQIKNAKTKKDLRAVLSSLCHAYRDAMKELIEDGKISKERMKYNGVGIYNWLEKDSNAVLAITLKTITNAYFYEKLQTISMEKLKSLKEGSDADIPYNQLLEQLGEKFSDVAKANGVDRLATKALQYNLSNTYLSRLQKRAIDSFGGVKKRLTCLNCENRECKLLYYWDRLPIESFDYVKDAVLIIPSRSSDESLNYDNPLMVFGCSKYQIDSSFEAGSRFSKLEKTLKR